MAELSGYLNNFHNFLCDSARESLDLPPHIGDDSFDLHRESMNCKLFPLIKKYVNLGTDSS